MKHLVSMREALEDPELLGTALQGPSWAAWRVILMAILGEPLNDEERTLFTCFTGREVEPSQPVEEFWGIIGRRGGKTRAMATLAAYLAALCDHSEVLAIGERGIIPILAASTDQAKTAFSYVVGLFENVPMLKAMIEGNPTADTLSLSNSIDIRIRPASFRTARGVTAIAVLGDEVAFWRSDESVNPDSEILAALRPALATTGGPLIVISSPYARKGELYNTWKSHFGPQGDPLILVAQGASRELNPSLQQRVIDRAMERDPAAASAEYLAQFRTDVEALLTREAVDGVTISGRFELPPLPGVRYFGFVDPSGGSADSFTIAIAHREGDKAVLDAVRERKPPFSPEAVVEEFATLLRSYGLAAVTGDRYAGEWPRERFHVHGIRYELSELPTTEIYLAFLPLVNGGRVELLEHTRLSVQLVALERKTSRTGRDTIAHPLGGHDDLANAVAGVLVRAGSRRRGMIISDEALARSRKFKFLNNRRALATVTC